MEVGGMGVGVINFKASFLRGKSTVLWKIRSEYFGYIPVHAYERILPRDPPLSIKTANFLQSNSSPFTIFDSAH
jgi:hypothetical protein